MSKEAVARLQQTDLYKKLREKEDLKKKETSIEDYEISQNISSLVGEVIPLLERIPENMPEFTLHNANHSIHVIENMGKIIPSDTLNKLDTVEISILIYAAFLHDIGMIASTDEKTQIVETDEFKKLLTSDEETYNKFEEARKNGEYRIASNLENKLFTKFLRKNHVQRADKIIKEYKLPHKISWDGNCYYKLVKAVCESHELNVKDLNESELWPTKRFVQIQEVNVQYLAVILRLADKLDLDKERTPKHLFYYINPKDEISIKEWTKHLSITGYKITSEEINIEAESKHLDNELALREFIEEIDIEIKESHHLISSYRDDLRNTYKLNLSKPVNMHVQSIGYQFCKFRFELDFHRVLELLMGERLYGKPIVALRELLQNSIDAVCYRESLERKNGNGYRPYIEISLCENKLTKENILTVEDNGIGMDEEIFQNYFMKIGRSYYQSLDFRNKNIDIDPVSEFGIGILSVFMIASNFTVESKKRTFEDEPNLYKPIYFEIPTSYGYFVKRSSNLNKAGTKITLYLKPNHPFSAETLKEQISKIAPFIPYNIAIRTINGIETYEPFSPREKIEHGKYIKEYFEVIFDDEREGIEGRLRIVNFLNKEKDDSKYNCFAQTGFAIPYQKLLPSRLFSSIETAINLSGKSKLSLSPSRSDVVEDDRYIKLIETIQSRILDGLENYLKTKINSKYTQENVETINELLENKIIGIHGEGREVSIGGFYHSEKEFNLKLEEIFRKYVPLLVISEDGQRTYKTIENIKKTSFTIVGFNDWPEKIPDAVILKEAKCLVGEATVLLMNEEVGKTQRNQFLKRILGNYSSIYITSVPGVVIEEFNINKVNEVFNFDAGVPFTQVAFANIICSNTTEKTPLFVHSTSSTGRAIRNIYLNAQHPFCTRLLYNGKPKDNKSVGAINILLNKIVQSLEHLDNVVYSTSDRQIYGLNKSVNTNYMYIGILKYHPELFQILYNSMEQYWEGAKNTGVLSCNDNFIGF